MSFLNRIFGSTDPRTTYRPLYNATVNAGRDPLWYLEGQVPDTIDGRFDMIAAVLALVLLRLEAEEARTRAASVHLAELFIEDMEGSIRQLGAGDVVVGKRIGKMMGALGGRLSAFRSALAAGQDFTAAVRRNIFHEAPPSERVVEIVAERLLAFHHGLRARPVDAVLAGEIPTL